jgi:hypothetical protein
MNIVVASVVYVNVIHVVLLRKTTIVRSTVLVLVAIHT